MYVCPVPTERVQLANSLAGMRCRPGAIYIRCAAGNCLRTGVAGIAPGCRPSRPSAPAVWA